MSVTRKIDRKIVMMVFALLTVVVMAFVTSGVFAQQVTTNGTGGSECTPSSFRAYVHDHRYSSYRSSSQDFIEARSWVTVCGPSTAGFDEVGFRFVLPPGATVPNGEIGLALMGLDGCELENDTGIDDEGNLIINISCNVILDRARYNAETGLHSVYMRVRLPIVDDLKSLTDSFEITSYYQASQGLHRSNISEKTYTYRVY